MINQESYPSPSNYVAQNRGVIKPGEYLILPHENRCSSEHSKFSNTDEVVLTTRNMGANYVMSEMIIRSEGGTIQPIENKMEHFLFVLNGETQLTIQGSQFGLEKGGFAWVPPNQRFEIINAASSDCRLLWFRKPYIERDGVDIPPFIHGNEKEVPALKEVDINPEKQLLPYTNLGFDMAFNMIVCQPGGYYGLVESHAWEHAMFILEGEGLLALNNNYWHVKENDFVHIFPYCPEWFTATGMEGDPVRFLLYWDCNRDYEDEF